MEYNFVRFVRGSLTNYKALAVKDEHTLYFVYDEATGASAIYLGSRMITGSGEISGASNLSELNDIHLADLANQDVLMYNAENNQWNNIAFSTFVNDLKGELSQQNISVNEKIFELDANGRLNLVGFDAAAPGTVLMKDLSGNVVWSTLDISAVLTAISDLETAVTDLETSIDDINDAIDLMATEIDNKANSSDVYTKSETDVKIGEAIANADHLERVIVDSLESIDLTATNAEKFIYMVPASAADDEDKYDEYMLINGALERVGSWEVDLSNYATLEKLDEKVDKQEGYTLIAEEDVSKLAGIEDGAQVNIIDEVSEEFEVTPERKTLTIKTIDASKIVKLVDHSVIKTMREDIDDIKARLDSSYATKEELGEIQDSITWEDI